MITVTSVRDIPPNAIRAVTEPDGTILVYMPGDTLPPAPPVDETPEVPQSVTMRQARIALLGAGLLQAVNTAIANMPGPEGEAARIEWEYSQEVHRNRGLVKSLGGSLGMTPAQLDALFIAAAQIA